MTNDPELEELFQDPAHREVVDLLKMSQPETAPPLDPNFRTMLRIKLMTEARRTLQPRGARRGFSFSLRPKALVPATAAVAATPPMTSGMQPLKLRAQAKSAVAMKIGIADVRGGVVPNIMFRLRANWHRWHRTGNEW